MLLQEEVPNTIFVRACIHGGNISYMGTARL